MQLLLALSLLLPADAPPSVRLAPNARTPGERILLVDVLDAADLRLVPPALLGVDLGASPSAGYSRELSRADIERALPPDALELAGAKEVLVEPDTKAIPGKEILSAAGEWLRSSLPIDADVRIDVAREPTEVLVPRGRRSLELQPRPGTSRALRGSVSLDVAIVVDGAALAVVPVSFFVHTFAEGAVMLRALRRGERLSPEDVERRRIETTTSGAIPVSDPSRLFGHEARRPIQAGEAVSPRDFDAPLLVRRGDPVTLLVVRGALRASAHGVARADGRRGEIVSVQNVATRKLVSGRVESEGLVLVEP